MRTCPTCGGAYPEDQAVCPKDRTPLGARSRAGQRLDQRYLLQKPLPALEVVEKPKLAQPSRGLSLSPKRKVLAGVLGGLALGSLIGAVALTATDGNVTSMDCAASAGVNKICVLDNKIPSSVGYVMAGAFTVGTVLTLLWPESTPQPKASAQAEAAK